jgi:hypothetical protein
LSWDSLNSVYVKGGNASVGRWRKEIFLYQWYRLISTNLFGGASLKITRKKIKEKYLHQRVLMLAYDIANQHNEAKLFQLFAFNFSTINFFIKLDN